MPLSSLKGHARERTHAHTWLYVELHVSAAVPRRAETRPGVPLTISIVPSWRFACLAAVTWETNAWIIVVAVLPRILPGQSVGVARKDLEVLVRPHDVACRRPVLLQVVIDREGRHGRVAAVVHLLVVGGACGANALHDVVGAGPEQLVEG